MVQPARLGPDREPAATAAPTGPLRAHAPGRPRGNQHGGPEALGARRQPAKSGAPRTPEPAGAIVRRRVHHRRGRSGAVPGALRSAAFCHGSSAIDCLLKMLS